MPGGGAGFIGIDVKHHERLDGSRAANRGRPSEVARRSGVFHEGSLEVLDRPPLQQLRFDHLLALAMLQHDDRWGGNGLFVLLHPAANPVCFQVASDYQEHLRHPGSFQRRTLEEVVGVLAAHAADEWVEAFRDRYLDQDKIRRLS